MYTQLPETTELLGSYGSSILHFREDTGLFLEVSASRNEGCMLWLSVVGKSPEE